MPWDAIIWHDFWLLIGEMNTITEGLHFQGNVFFVFGMCLRCCFLVPWKCKQGMLYLRSC